MDKDFNVDKDPREHNGCFSGFLMGRGRRQIREFVSQRKWTFAAGEASVVKKYEKTDHPSSKFL